MASPRFLHPSRIAVVLATSAALVGGFLLAATVISGGDSPSASEYARPLNPEPSSYVKLTPGDDGFSEFSSEFSEFPIYWVGEEFGGHSLRFIIRHVFSPEDGSPTQNSVRFLYGTCDSGGEGGCAPPLQIIVQPYCLVPPGVIAPVVISSGMTKVRGGADAMLVGDGLRIWTGDITLKIYAANTQLLEDATAAFFSPNGLGPPAAGDELPVPNRDCSEYEMIPYPTFN